MESSVRTSSVGDVGSTAATVPLTSAAAAVTSAAVAERDRLDALASYRVLDSAPEAAFDALVQAATDVAGVPTALVSLVDDRRQWFKARMNLAVCETDRDVAFCDVVVRNQQELVVPDATRDPRFAANPLVVGEPHIRFYAGFPLTTAEGHVLGTLCVIGYAPAELTEVQRRILRTLASQVVAQLDLRRQLLDSHETLARMSDLQQAEARAAVQLRAAQAAADADRAMLTTVLDTLDVGVVACDRDGRLTVVNRAAREFNVAEPGAAPTRWQQQVPVYDENGTVPLAGADRPLIRALSAEPGDGAVVGAVVAMGPPAPDRQLLSLNARQLTTAAGEVAGAVVAMTDITASRRAAQALRVAHEQLSEALDAMPRSVTLADVQRDETGTPVGLSIRWINAYVRRLIGCDVDGVAGQSFAVVFPAVTERHLRSYLEVARTGEPLVMVAEWFDGEIARGAFDVTVTAWGDDGLLIDVVDVTARHAAEQALRMSEQRLRDAQSQAGLAGWEWDVSTDALTWSPLMFDLLGVDAAVTPTSAMMLGRIHPEDRETFVQHTRHAIRHHASTSTLDFRVQRDDGQCVWIRAHATIERDPGGRAVRVWGTDQDISAARAKESELARAADTDPLTGLLNRRGWDRESARLLAAVTDDPVAVVMLDLDHFKAFNDAFGHAAGDELLRTCSRRWTSRLRSHDLLARVGGEEFACC